MPFYPTPEAPKLKLPVLLDAKFTIVDVPVKRLAGHFDLRDCPFDTLVKAGGQLLRSQCCTASRARGGSSRCEGTTLRGLNIPLTKPAPKPAQPESDASGTAPSATATDSAITMQELLDTGIDFKGAKATDLFAQGLKMDGCKLNDVLGAEMELRGLELETFIAAGGDCTGTLLERLQEEGVSFAGVSFEDLRHAEVSMQGVTAARLLELVDVKDINVKDLLDEKVVGEGIHLTELLGRGVSFDAVSVNDLRKWNAGPFPLFCLRAAQPAGRFQGCLCEVAAGQRCKPARRQ